MHEDAEYISVESAGKLLGVSSRTVRNWVVSGKLPAISGKRGRLIRRADVLRLGTVSGKLPEDVERPEISVSSSAELPESNGDTRVARPQWGQLQTDIETRYLDTIEEIRRGFELQLQTITSAHDETVAAKDQTIAAKDEVISQLRAERDTLQKQLATVTQVDEVAIARLEKYRDVLERDIDILEKQQDRIVPGSLWFVQKRHDRKQQRISAEIASVREEHDRIQRDLNAAIEALESPQSDDQPHQTESPSVADSAPQTNDSAPWWRRWWG